MTGFQISISEKMDKLLNLSRYNFKMVMYYYILKQPREVPWKEGVLILNSDYLADACGWAFYFRREADGCFSMILTAHFTLQHLVHLFS